LSAVQTELLTVDMGEGNDFLGLFGTHSIISSVDGGGGSDFLLSLLSPGIDDFNFESALEF
jgi:hypothetical protein